MGRVFGRVFWVLSVLALIVVVVFYFTKDQQRRHDAARTKKALEEKIETAKRTSLDDLEKFLDGQEREKKLQGQVGRSEMEGQALASTRKVKRELEGEAIDLERFLEEESDTFRKDEGILAEGTTDLHQEVMWRIVGDWVYFRLAFSPFDAATNELRKGSEEAVFLCFNDSSGQRVVPATASARIPMRNFYQRMEDDKPMGWAFNGKLSLTEVDSSSLDHSRVGWIFSEGLHSHLRMLKDVRAGGGEVESRKVLQP